MEWGEDSGHCLTLAQVTEEEYFLKILFCKVPDWMHRSSLNKVIFLK